MFLARPVHARFETRLLRLGTKLASMETPGYLLVLPSKDPPLRHRSLRFGFSWAARQPCRRAFHCGTTEVESYYRGHHS